MIRDRRRQTQIDSMAFSRVSSLVSSIGDQIDSEPRRGISWDHVGEIQKKYIALVGCLYLDKQSSTIYNGKLCISGQYQLYCIILNFEVMTFELCCLFAITFHLIVAVSVLVGNCSTDYGPFARSWGHKIGLQLSLAFRHYLVFPWGYPPLSSTRHEFVSGRLRHMNAPCDSVAFHARGSVHLITEQHAIRRIR